MALDTLESPSTETNSNQYEPELYKKWFKAGGQSGFLSITPFTKAARFTIDIGKINPDNGSVQSHTQCWIDGVDLSVYLNSVVNGTAVDLFPQRGQCPSPESFITYGGSAKASPVIARVFKTHYWGAKKDNIGDPKGFAWKCGHFEGRATDTGAIEPIFDKPIGADMIRVSRLEMTEIALRVKLCMIGWASNNPQWYHNER